MGGFAQHDLRPRESAGPVDTDRARLPTQDQAALDAAVAAAAPPVVVTAVAEVGSGDVEMETAPSDVPDGALMIQGSFDSLGIGLEESFLDTSVDTFMSDVSLGIDDSSGADPASIWGYAGDLDEADASVGVSGEVGVEWDGIPDGARYDVEDMADEHMLLSSCSTWDLDGFQPVDPPDATPDDSQEVLGVDDMMNLDGLFE
jgi:hypothetical protein